MVGEAHGDATSEVSGKRRWRERRPGASLMSRELKELKRDEMLACVLQRVGSSTRLGRHGDGSSDEVTESGEQRFARPFFTGDAHGEITASSESQSSNMDKFDEERSILMHSLVRVVGGGLGSGGRRRASRQSGGRGCGELGGCRTLPRMDIPHRPNFDALRAAPA